jgi:hypothetical protein
MVCISTSHGAFPSFRSSRPGLFSDLSTGEFCPLRILRLRRSCGFPPQISHEKDGGLPPPPKGDGIFESHFRKAP